MNSDTLFPATAMPDKDWWQALWPDPEAVLHRLGFRAGMTAIDLCCGDGHFTVPMSIQLNGRVYGVDLDAAMLAAAKIATEKANAPPVRFIEGDARALPALVDEKVDRVLIANTFHGVPDQTALARSVAAVLKPAGQFVVVNWHARPREETPVLGQPRGPQTALRMAPDDVVEVVEPAGFDSVAVVDLPPYHYGAIFSLKE